MSKHPALPWRLVVEFRVNDLPRPAGSKRPFYIEKIKRSVITDANPKAKEWKRSVSNAAVIAYDGQPLHEQLRLEIDFYLCRPKSHYGSGKNARIIKPAFKDIHGPIVMPDLTKLIRGTEDACTKILWQDDACIISQGIDKWYVDNWEFPYAIIRVLRIDELVDYEEVCETLQEWERGIKAGKYWARFQGPDAEN